MFRKLFGQLSRSSTQVALMAAAMVAAWVGVMIWARHGEAGRIDPYLLGAREGLLPLQLVAYSFLHTGWDKLFHDVVWFAVLVNAGRWHFRPIALVRLYSLGAVGGGLLRVALARASEEPTPVSGAALPILTMLGALGMLERRPISLLGDSPVIKGALALAWIVFVAAPPFLNQVAETEITGSYMLRLTLWYGSILALAMFRLRPLWVVAAWFTGDVMLLIAASLPRDALVVLVTELVGLGAGVAYVLIERGWLSIAARRQAAGQAAKKS